MTISKAWALIVGILVVGSALIGAVVWRQQYPAAGDLAKVVSLVAPKSSAPEPPAAAPSPKTAKPAAPSVAALETKPSPPPKPEPAAGHGEAPHFDVVRVEPTGEAVLAGKGDPNAEVALVEAGKVVAQTKADPAGNFVILPPPLKPGDHDLTLRQGGEGKPAVDSKQAVAVSVPGKAGSPVVVALAEPGKPTRLISGPPQAPSKAAPAAAAAPAPAKAPEAAADKVARAEPETAVAPPRAIAPNGPGLAIRSAELENGTGFYATGVAAPGTHVQLYLNGSHLAGVTAGADGQWSVTIKKGLTAGHYAVRADALGQGGKVVARAEVPFDVPVAMAAAPTPARPSAAPAPAAAASPAPVIAAAETAPEPPAAPDPDEVAGLGIEQDQPVTANAMPEPPTAPSPSDVAGLGPETRYAPPDDTVSEVPTPRPDIAAAAKSAANAATAKTPSEPILALAPPVAPDAKPRQTPATVAPAEPAKAPPTLTAEKPSVAPPTPAGAPAVTAETTAATSSTAKPASPADAVIDEVETALVVPGDNLWNISRTKLGLGRRYTQIYAANVSQIRDPRLIFPGQVFVVPAK